VGVHRRETTDRGEAASFLRRPKRNPWELMLNQRLRTEFTFLLNHI
jgi:hypothetical protein